MANNAQLEVDAWRLMAEHTEKWGMGPGREVNSWTDYDVRRLVKEILAAERARADAAEAKVSALREVLGWYIERHGGLHNREKCGCYMDNADSETCPRVYYVNRLLEETARDTR